MTVPLTGLLQHVLRGEPELGDEVDEIFRRADRLRRRRTRALLGAGAAAVAAIAVAGYLLTTTLLPGGPRPVVAPPVAVPAEPSAANPSAADPSAAEPSAAEPSAATPSTDKADPVLAVLRPVVDQKQMEIFPRPPERGNGWRQYSVLDSEGRPRGTIEVAIYHVAKDLCFPVVSSPGSCARTEWAPKGVEFVRYDDEKDPDYQVHQTIARRITDGRTLAVMATGERDGDAKRGKPALTGKQIEQVATGQQMFDAFGPDEKCTGPSAGACPAFRVPVPTED
jgi:hypothetical protein